MQFHNPIRRNHSAIDPVIEDYVPESDILKLKLALDKSHSFDTLQAIEAQWRNHIEGLDRQSQVARRVKLYDLIGRPVYRKPEELTAAELSQELSRFKDLLISKGVILDFGSDYEESVIYRFVTEELFDQEIDDVPDRPATTHFIYEEFHPNHDRDLRQYANELIDIIFRKKWDRFDSHCFAEKILFKDTEYDNEGIAEVIQEFQSGYDSFAVTQFEIDDVLFDEQKGYAEIQGLIRYATRGFGIRAYGGTCKISFRRQWGYWYIDGFRFPGFGEQ